MTGIEEKVKKAWNFTEAQRGKSWPALPGKGGKLKKYKIFGVGFNALGGCCQPLVQGGRGNTTGGTISESQEAR